jgi:hypothetical protein
MRPTYHQSTRIFLTFIHSCLTITFAFFNWRSLELIIALVIADAHTQLALSEDPATGALQPLSVHCVAQPLPAPPAPSSAPSAASASNATDAAFDPFAYQPQPHSNLVFLDSAPSPLPTASHAIDAPSSVPSAAAMVSSSALSSSNSSPLWCRSSLPFAARAPLLVGRAYTVDRIVAAVGAPRTRAIVFLNAAAPGQVCVVGVM